MVKKLAIISSKQENDPAYRYRIKQFIDYLPNFNFRVNNVGYFKNGRKSLKNFINIIHVIKENDIILIHRLTKVWLLLTARIFKKKIVFDIDDAVIYIRQKQLKSAIYPRTIREKAISYYRLIIRGNRLYSSKNRKMKIIVRLADKIIFGNEYFKDHYSDYENKITIVPTTVTVNGDIKKHLKKDLITIGWTGVTSNLFHLNILNETFFQLNKIFCDKILLKIISGVGGYKSDDINIQNQIWDINTELDEVKTFDIGIMPLQDDPFSRGKCSFKAILFMSLGIPVVISPVGMNIKLINNGENGFLANNTAEWIEYLSKLITDHTLRNKIGYEGYKTVKNNYSRESALPLLINVLKSI